MPANERIRFHALILGLLVILATWFPLDGLGQVLATAGALMAVVGIYLRTRKGDG